MLKKMMIAFVASALVGSAIPALAQDKIDFVVPQSSGGATFTMVNMLRDDLISRGYNITEAKALNNCAAAREFWNTTKDPVISSWESAYNSNKNPNCILDIDPNTFVQVMTVSPVAFCSIKKITLDDYRKGKNTYKVGVQRHVPHDILFAQLEKDTGNKHVLLQYKNTAEVQAALKSGEIDFALMGQVWSERAGATCMWTTSTTATNGVPTMKSIWPNNPIAESGNMVWWMAKNLTPAQMEKLRKDFKEIYNTPKVVEFVNMRGFEGTGYSFEQAKSIESTARKHNDLAQ